MPEAVPLEHHNPKSLRGFVSEDTHASRVDKPHKRSIKLILVATLLLVVIAGIALGVGLGVGLLRRSGRGTDTTTPRNGYGVCFLKKSMLSCFKHSESPKTTTRHDGQYLSICNNPAKFRSAALLPKKQRQSSSHELFFPDRTLADIRRTETRRPRAENKHATCCVLYRTLWGK